jgi:hypothetical protein
MADRDKVIKSGQVTLPRVLFLAAIGGIIVFTVYAGGIYLAIGYWFITLSICVLLFLIAIDYGVKMEKVNLAVDPAQAAAAAVESTNAATPDVKAAGEVRPKKRTSRPAKRRR